MIGYADCPIKTVEWKNISLSLPCVKKQVKWFRMNTVNYCEVNLLNEFLVTMGQEDKSGKFSETLLLQQSYPYNISS